MTTIALEHCDVSDLDVFVNPADLRKDFQHYIDYVDNRLVTRTHRENRLSKADARRLAKLCGDPDAREEIDDTGMSSWLSILEYIALTLKLVRYDTEGSYAGYTSSEPSFPDNEIDPNEQKISEYTQLLLQDRESLLLSALTDNYAYDDNEWLQRGAFSRLDHFSYRGCACGVMPHIRFDQARKTLLKVLAQCEPNTWYSTASFIEYIKKKHRYFLIPKVLPAKIHKHERERYDNFSEQLDRNEYKETKITENQPQAYERVEGRYIERFLEGAPLEMGYVDVAYTKEAPNKLAPSIGCLKAFRLHPRFFLAWRKVIPEPTVTILPNFEVHIESLLYPTRVLKSLKPMCDIISEDVHTVLRLKKQKIAHVQAENDQLDIIKFLEDLSSKPLPTNVRQELDVWCGHANKFVLYKGFGLFEGKVDTPEVQHHLVERISSTKALIADPKELYADLEDADVIPIFLRHHQNKLSKAPQGTKSLFAAKKTKASTKKEIITRSISVTLCFPSKSLFDDFLKDLLGASILLASNKSKLSFTYSNEQAEKVLPVLNAFKKKHPVRVVG